jgi:hypothetical protein
MNTATLNNTLAPTNAQAPYTRASPTDNCSAMNGASAANATLGASASTKSSASPAPARAAIQRPRDTGNASENSAPLPDCTSGLPLPRSAAKIVSRPEKFCWNHCNQI